MFTVTKNQTTQNYKLFEYLQLNYSGLCQCHTTDMKISKKSYKTFEAKK